MTIIEHADCVKTVKFFAWWVSKRCRTMDWDDAYQDLWMEVLKARKKFIGKDPKQFVNFVRKHLEFRSKNIVNKYHKQCIKDIAYAKEAKTVYEASGQSFDSLVNKLIKHLEKTKKQEKSYENTLRVLTQWIDPDTELLRLGEETSTLKGEPRQIKLNKGYKNWQLGAYLGMSPMQISRSLNKIKQAAEYIVDH